MITLDSDKHIYTDEEGRVVPGVTSVLQPLQNFAGIPKTTLQAAADFGKHVHLACELYDNGVLDEAMLDENLAPYLVAWKSFLQDTGFKITENEKLVYSEKFKYAGTLDRTGILNGKQALVDIKSTAVASPVTGPQTAAYSQAYKEMGGYKRPARFTVHLAPNKYKLVPHKDGMDFQVFMACLSVFNWRKFHYK